MLKVVVGHSNDPDSELAIAEVLQQCRDSLENRVPKAGILLAAIDFDHSLILEQIFSVFPDLELIGGTTDGEISSILDFQQDSLILMLFCSDSLEIRAGIGLNVSADPVIAAKQAVETAKTALASAPRLCITIPESLTVSGVSLMEGLKQTLGVEVPIFGGLAADQWRFQQTHQFYQNQVLSDAVPILLLAGEFNYAHGAASGWYPIGQKGRVTKVEQNVVYEIDNQPALKFYHRSLGGIPPSMEYPLAVFEQEIMADGQHFYMRSPTGVYDPESGSITFFGDVPLNAIVQVTETSPEQILEASQLSMQQALNQYPGQEPAAALFFSCAGRRQILGTRTQEEYQQVKACLPYSLTSCGFYTNGEIAPLKLDGETCFHNETFITLLLGDR
ncbi:FIST C-terminal domain-containing protein [Phormidium sp. LEGE 05292]|uniref:FIST signal transduction protein n=1 Tax=[Phormidium] sp. LEGE 05292 TaxID=767427 RepID=UPI00187FF9AD|nr:FIST N-terminal domain-containing protein [Phormidium sp. LEGE 05292]MBE9228282.1 FIST C-terminal domain-containing protein [Phormidium sp. LEGE 05292]